MHFRQFKTGRDLEVTLLNSPTRQPTLSFDLKLCTFIISVKLLTRRTILLFQYAPGRDVEIYLYL